MRKWLLLLCSFCSLCAMEHAFEFFPAPDSIFECFQDKDKTFVEERRQIVLSAKKKALLMEDPKALGEEVYRNYLRNKKMIDLTEDSECPESVKQEIINTFVNQNREKQSGKVFPYLISKNCRLLIECVGEFI